MNDMIGSKPPAWFWALAVIGLLWNLYGIWAYLGFVGTVATPMTDAERSIAATMPVWAHAAFAIAVFAGALGALGLVLRKAWAKLLLLLSLLAVLVQQAWFLGMSGALDTLGASGAGLPIAIILVAVVLYWLAGTGAKRGWLS